jgi:hypothetical protein
MTCRLMCQYSVVEGLAACVLTVVQVGYDDM